MPYFLRLSLSYPLFMQPNQKLCDVGMVARDVVAVTVHEGAVSLGELIPYNAEPNDELKVESLQRTSVRRDGREIGTLVGPKDRQMVRTPDRFTGTRVDRKRLVAATAWSIPGGPKIKSASFKNRVLDAANVEGGDWKAAYEYVVFPEARRAVG